MYAAILEELKFEKTERAAFKLDKEKLVEVLENLKNIVHEYKDIISTMKGADGRFYEDGLYGYYMDKAPIIEEETGVKFR